MTVRQKTCAIVGSFDPVTLGHLWLIERSLCIFDNAVVCVADNPNKKHMLSSTQRCSLVYQSLDESSHIPSDRVSVEIIPLNQSVPATMKRLNIRTLVRGVRNGQDFDYEQNLSTSYQIIDDTIQMVFLPAPPHLAVISSSLVRGCIHLAEWDDIKYKLITKSVVDAIEGRG